MKIKMLGVGNGFSKGVFDTNALLYNNDSEFAMVDCGTTAWTSLDILGISREQIKSIFLTHIHFDHSGGIESAALYGKFVEGRKMRLIVPAPIRERIWDNYLKGAIEDNIQGFTALEDFFDVVSPQEGEEFTLLDGIVAKWFHVKHLEGKFACGLLINNEILYTGDMLIDEKLLLDAVRDGAKHIVHDVCFRKVINHAHYDEILRYPSEIKDKLHLIHHGLLDDKNAPNDGVKFLYQHVEYEF